MATIGNQETVFWPLHHELKIFEVSAVWRYNLQKKLQKSVRYNQVSAMEVSAI